MPKYEPKSAAADIGDVLALLSEQLGIGINSIPGDVKNLANSLVRSVPAATDDQVVQSVLSALSSTQGQAAKDPVSEFLGGRGVSISGTADPYADLLAGLGGNTGDFLSLEQLAGLGLSPDQANDALLTQFGIGGPSLDIARQNANTSSANAAIAAASQRAQEAYQAAIAAVQAGELELAKQQFDAANYWQQVTNQFSAVGAGTDIYNAETSNLATRGGLDVSAGNIYGNLVTTVGDLADRQARLGLDILTTPRNAVAGFLIGQGANPETAAQFGQFDVKRLLGIDPGQIQGLIDAATAAARTAQSRADKPATVDLQDLLSRLAAAADKGVPAPPVASGDTSEGGTAAPTVPEAAFQRKPQSAPVSVRPNNPIIQQAYGPLGADLYGFEDIMREAANTSTSAPTSGRSLRDIAQGVVSGIERPAGASLLEIIQQALYPAGASQYPGSTSQSAQPSSPGLLGLTDLLRSPSSVLDDYGPQGSPQGQELWGAAMRDALMEQLRQGR